MKQSALSLMWAAMQVHPHVSEENAAFHIHVLEKAQGAIGLANRRLKQIDPAIVSTVKLGRQAEILQGLKARLEAEARFASKKWRDRKAQLEAEMEAMLHPPTPDDPFHALRAEMKLQAIRAEVLALPADKRLQAVMEAAQRGLPGLLNALDGGLSPVVPAASAKAVRDTFLKAVCPEKITYLENTEKFLDECERSTVLLGPAFANVLLKDHQVDPSWQRVTPAQMAASWPEGRKIQFMAANGEAAYRALMGAGTGYQFPEDKDPLPTIA